VTSAGFLDLAISGADTLRDYIPIFH
jgi:hypothetical protein